MILKMISKSLDFQRDFDFQITTFKMILILNHLYNILYIIRGLLCKSCNSLVTFKKSFFEGQKNEMMKKKNQKIEHDDKLCHRKELPSSNDGKNILERSGTTKHTVWGRSNRHESRRNR